MLLFEMLKHRESTKCHRYPGRGEDHFLSIFFVTFTLLQQKLFVSKSADPIIGLLAVLQYL